MSFQASHLADFGRRRLRRWLCWCWGGLRRRLRLMLGLGLRLGLQAVSGDLVNLPRCRHIHHVIRLHLNLVTRRQEGVETHDQVWVAFEELRHAADHSWSVNTEGGIRSKCHDSHRPYQCHTKFFPQEFSIRIFTLSPLTCKTTQNRFLHIRYWISEQH